MGKHRDEEWLRKQYFENGLTQIEIAERADVSRSTIQRAFRRFGIRTGQGYSVPIIHQSDGYAQLHDAVSGDKVQHSRLLATLLVDEVDDLRGQEIHHEISPYVFNEVFGFAADLNWIGNIEPVSHSRHREIGHSSQRTKTHGDEPDE